MKMTWKNWMVVVAVGLILLVAVACRRQAADSQLIVEIPSGFNGNFQLEMGVNDAPPLMKQGDAYVVVVPKSGKVSTSTLLADPKASFQNASDGGVWGYAQSVFTTGDGIPVSGKIEFFVGTKTDYEADENKKKNHSEEFEIPSELSGV